EKLSGNMVVPGGRDRYRNDGRFRSRGIELFLRRPQDKRLAGWLSYSLSKTEIAEHEKDTFYPSTFDQTHVLTLAGLWRINATHEVGGRGQYHTGDTYNEVRKSYYSPSSDSYSPIVE